MAITIDTSISTATANSYLTLDEINQAIATLGVCGDAWCHASDAQQAQMVVAAARRLDRLRFIGQRANPMQSMEWPRIGGPSPFVWSIPHGRFRPFRTPYYGSVWSGIYDLRDRFWTAAEVPQPVKEAQMALVRDGIQAACSGAGSQGSSCAGIESISAFGVSAKFRAPSASVVPDEVSELLGDFVLTGSGLVKA